METLVKETVAAKKAGFKGAKIKVGKPHVSDDVARLKECFTLSEALRRARASPRQARCPSLSANRSTPPQFAAYIQQGAASIVRVDVARVGGITPWLKVAHMAEAFNLAVCPHFPMELHVSLCAAAPSAAWVEYIPQLDAIATSRLAIEDGYAVAPDTPGVS